MSYDHQTHILRSDLWTELVPSPINEQFIIIIIFARNDQLKRWRSIERAIDDEHERSLTDSHPRSELSWLIVWGGEFNCEPKFINWMKIRLHKNTTNEINYQSSRKYRSPEFAALKCSRSNEFANEWWWRLL